jgi:ZIP family zinc transporter
VTWFAPLDPLGQALLLTLLAGLSTGIGALLTVAAPRSQALLAQGMAFSAGAMIAVSFVELLPAAASDLGMVGATAALLLGSLGGFALDLAVPHLHAMGKAFGGAQSSRESALATEAHAGFSIALRAREEAVAGVNPARVALVATLAVALHNFPEGFAVFAGAAQSLQLGLVLAVAIAAHNIPEGMAVAAPVLRATGSRTRAFWAGTGSGLLEPLGAICGGLLLYPLLTSGLIGAMLAFVAGVMVYVSLDELLPAARVEASAHAVALSVMLGVAFMLLTLAALKP